MDSWYMDVHTARSEVRRLESRLRDCRAELAEREKEYAESVRVLRACDEALARYGEGYKKLADTYDNGWDCPHCSHAFPEDNGAFGHQPKDGEQGACPIGSALTRLEDILSKPHALRVLEVKP